eukprot:scaffold1068_cov375-Prasinococcus_capsulatus_cf.AAC.16
MILLRLCSRRLQTESCRRLTSGLGRNQPQRPHKTPARTSTRRAGASDAGGHARRQISMSTHLDGVVTPEWLAANLRRTDVKVTTSLVERKSVWTEPEPAPRPTLLRGPGARCELVHAQLKSQSSGGIPERKNSRSKVQEEVSR